MPYFGIFNDIDIANLDSLERERIFLSHGLLIRKKTFSISTSKNTQKSGYIKTVFHPSLQYEFEFKIQESIKPILDNSFERFFATYNDAVFGLEPVEAKRIALQHYKQLTTKTSLTYNKLVFVSKNQYSSGKVDSIPRLSLLKGEAQGEILNLMETKVLDYFLEGNTKAIENEITKEHSLLDRYLDIGCASIILHRLNEEFSFEKIVKADYFWLNPASKTIEYKEEAEEKSIEAQTLWYLYQNFFKVVK